MAGWIVLSVLLVGGWIYLLFTKSGRSYLRDRINQGQAFETRRVRKRAYGPERLFTPFGSRYYVVTKPVLRKGWWQASDGRWYPPESHPKYKPLPPPPTGRLVGRSTPVDMTCPRTYGFVAGPVSLARPAGQESGDEPCRGVGRAFCSASTG